MAENPPAWHPDPTGTHDHRWWDGQRWTEHVADAGVAAVDPLPAAPPAGGQTGAEQAGAEQPAADAGTTGAGTAGAPDAGATPWSAGGGAAAGGATQQPAWGSDQPGTGDAGAQQPAWSTEGQQAAWPGTEAGGGDPAWNTGDPAWNTGDAWGSQGAGSAPTGDPNRTSGLALTALILGMLAIPSAIVLIGGLLGIVAIVLGAVASGKAKRGEAGGRGIAIGGIITGSIGLVIAVGLFITVFANIAGDVTACIEETGDPEACQAELERDLMDRFG